MLDIALAQVTAQYDNAAMARQVLTPVRRSARKAATSAVDAGSMLRKTRFTYAPNEAMQPRLDPKKPLGETTRANLFDDSPMQE